MLLLCIYRKLTCPAVVGVYQQVYQVRHRVWSCRSQDITAAQSHHSSPLDDSTSHQSVDEDKEQQEKLKDKDDEKRDGEQWNDAQSDSK